MTPIWFLLACQACAVACALVAGVFLTFSDFVMRSLAGAKTAAGIESMQVINREVYRSVFIVLLLGMAAVSPLLIGYAYLKDAHVRIDLVRERLSERAQWWIELAGCLLFLQITHKG